MSSVRVLNCSEIAFNDKHNYFGGAIGNIGYNLVSSLVTETSVRLTTFATDTDLEAPTPDGLDVIVAKDFDAMEARFDQVVTDVDPDAFAHLYFYEPVRNPVFNRRQPLDRPFVIGMCERPHTRYADETTGIERLRVVRTLGRLVLLPRFKRTIRACDKLIVVDESAKEYYANYLSADRIDVVPYGVDLEAFTPTSIPDQPRILVVSRLIRRRRIRDAVDALARLLEEFPDARLDLVGEGPQRAALAEQAETRGVRDAVTFHGNVDRDALVERYRSAYVYCHLSEEDGWNQTVLEAMASGRPVVASDRPHNSMVRDGDTGVLVPCGEVDELVEALRHLFEDPGSAAAMGERGRAVAEADYDWAGVANDYADSIREVA